MATQTIDVGSWLDETTAAFDEAERNLELGFYWVLKLRVTGFTQRRYEYLTRGEAAQALIRALGALGPDVWDFDIQHVRKVT